MVAPLVVAGGHTAGAIAGGGSMNTQILLMMTGSAVVIFVQNAKKGTPQQGDQFIAIGIVGFVLLFIASFWPEVAFGFAILFFVSVILNSPNGIPVIAPSTSKVSANTAQTGTTNSTVAGLGVFGPDTAATVAAANQAQGKG